MTSNNNLIEHEREQAKVNNWALKAIDYLGYFGPQILFFASLYLLIKWPIYLAFYLIGFATNVLVNIVLKGIFKHPRPNEDLRIFNISMNNGKRFGWDRYGMPSGHSQNAWFFFSFISLYIYNQYKNKPKNIYTQIITIFLIAILFIISTFISYSRVKVNCHSTNQVIVGGIIGEILGIFGYLLTRYIIEGY